MSEVWTVGSVLNWIEGYLADHGDASPRVSARWLVSDALGVGQMELYADLDRPLDEQERALLREHTRRRAAGEPLQYITGSAPFRFLTISVEPGVLIPRPETEVLVSEAIARLRTSFSLPAKEPADVLGPKMPLLMADVCTGSGNIACALATELPYAQVWATDLDQQACALASRNAREAGVADCVHVLQGSLMEPFPHELRGQLHAVVSNPPYIPTAVLQTLEREVTDYEPRLALDGGDDGLACVPPLLAQAAAFLRPGGVLAMELHETCLEQAGAHARAAGFADVCIKDDLTGRPRVLLATWPRGGTAE